MEVNVNYKNLENDQVEVNLEIPFVELEKEYNSLIQNYSTNISLPGFRKGKVPANIIKSKYGKDIQAETINKIIPKALEIVVKENEIKTYGPPKLDKNDAEEIEYIEGQDLKCRVTYSRPPECHLNPFDKIDIEAIKIKVTEDDLEQSVKEKIRPYAKSEKIEERWKLGDLLKIDVTFIDPDESLASLNLKDHACRFNEVDSEVGQDEVGKGAHPPWLNLLYGKLKNMKNGEQEEFTFDFKGNEVSVENLKNRTVRLKVKVNDVVRMVLPLVDEEILKKLNYPSEPAMRKDLQSNLEHHATDQENFFKQNQALNAVKTHAQFVLPDIAVEYYLYEQWQQMLNQIMGGGKIDEKFRNPSPEWLKENRERAKLEIENQLILDAIKRQENIEVGEEEMNQEIKSSAQKTGRDEKEFRRELIKSGQFTMLKNNLITKKSFDWLFSKSNVIFTKETSLQEISEKA